MLGGLVHLVIGVFYAVVFAALFAPITGWSKYTKGAIFGVAKTNVARGSIVGESAIGKMFVVQTGESR